MDEFTQTWENLAVFWRTEPDQRNHLFDVLHLNKVHRSFVKEASLRTWLRDLNLELDGRLIPGERVPIKGQYRTVLHTDVEVFNQTPTVCLNRSLSYGDFTLGLISEDESSLRTLHMMAPTAFGRVVFDLKQSRELVG